MALQLREPTPYKELYPERTRVRVADRSFLEQFQCEWKYHHNLTPEQLQFADRESSVKAVAFYHGGDPLYTLAGIPGLWHEHCLRPA